MIVVNILLFVALCTILFLLWQTRKFRGPTTPPSPQGAQPTQPRPPRDWWGERQQTAAVSILLAGLIFVLCPNEAKKLLDYPMIILAIVISVAILAIGGKWWASLPALITLVVLLGNNIFIPVVEKQIPKSWFVEKPVQPQLSKPAPKITELACATVVVPAGEIVNTYVFVRPRQRVHFYQSEPRTYYLHDKFKDLKICSQRFSCEFSDSDYIFLKGGPVTTMVTLQK